MAKRTGVPGIDYVDSTAHQVAWVVDAREGTDQNITAHTFEVWADDASTGTNMYIASLLAGQLDFYSTAASRSLGTSGNPWNSAHITTATLNGTAVTWPANAAGQLENDGAGNLSWAAGTTEVNDLSAVVTWANVPDANITESSVTQHEAALAIAFSQVTGTVPATQGGTGQTVYTVGDILYASTTTALTPLIAGTATHVLTSNGAGVAPSWQAVGGGTPGGSTTEIQYNLAGAFAGSSTFTLDGSGYLNVPRIIRGGSGHTKAGTYNANATIFDGGNSGATSLGGPATQTGWMMRLWGSGNFGTSSSGFGIENTAFWVNTSGTSFNTYVTGTLAMQVDAARTYIRDSVSAFSGRALAIYRQDLAAWATLSSGTGATTIGVDTNFQDNIGLIFGASGADAEMKWSGTSANDALHFGVNVSGLAASSANLNIVNQVYIDNDFDRPIATDPTVNIFSATDPDTNNTQYLSLTHNQTDGVIEVGTGAVSIAPATGSVKYRGIPYTWPASDSTGSQALQSNGSGVLSWVSVPNGADYLNKDGSVALTADWDAGSFDIRALTLTADSLTSGRVPYASTNGLLIDNAGLAFDGTTLDTNGITVNAGGVGYSFAGDTDTGIGGSGSGVMSMYVNAAVMMDFRRAGAVHESTFYSADGGALGPQLRFQHAGGSPLAGDVITEIDFEGQDSAFNPTDYARIEVVAPNVTNTTETGHIRFYTTNGGTLEENFRITSGGFIVNQNGLDKDFRVEGDTLPYLFFCEGAAATENIALLQDAAPNWQTGDRILNIGEATTEPTAAPAAGEGAFLWVNGTDDEIRARQVGQAEFSITQGVAKGWVLYDQTGTPAIDGSQNVASVTDTTTGDFTVNWADDFNDDNYATGMSTNDEAVGQTFIYESGTGTNRLAGSIKCLTATGGGTADRSSNCVVAFGVLA